MSLPPAHGAGLSKHNYVPSMAEPSQPVLGKLAKQKSSNHHKLGNYKPSDEKVFAASALARNGDYALKTDTWQKVDLEYRNKNIPSPMIAMSGSSLCSDAEFNYEEEKLGQNGNTWSNEDTGFVKRLLSSSKRK